MERGGSGGSQSFVPEQTIASAEDGQRAKWDTALKLAEALQVRPSDLAGTPPGERVRTGELAESPGAGERERAI